MTNLSVIVIGRDNQDTITSVVENGLQLGNEVVYVDTGSRDQTLSLGEKAGAKVIDFPMKEFDYSTPRCIGDKNASNDWVLHLDTDEKIDLAFKPRIDNIIANPKYHEYKLYQKSVINRVTQNETFLLARLYNHKKLKHKGLVWEVPFPIRRYGMSDIIIEHHKDLRLKNKKLELRLALERKEIKNIEEGKDLTNRDDLIELVSRISSMGLVFCKGESYEALDLLEKLMEYHRKIEKFSFNDEVSNLELYRAYINFNLKDIALGVLHEIEGKNNDYYMYWQMLGQDYLFLHSNPKCIPYLEKAINLEENSHSLIMYAIALYNTGRKTESKTALEKAINILPQDESIKRTYSSFFSK